MKQRRKKRRRRKAKGKEGRKERKGRKGRKRPSSGQSCLREFCFFSFVADHRQKPHSKKNVKGKNIATKLKSKGRKEGWPCKEKQRAKNARRKGRSSIGLPRKRLRLHFSFSGVISQENRYSTFNFGCASKKCIFLTCNAPSPEDLQDPAIQFVFFLIVLTMAPVTTEPEDW